MWFAVNLGQCSVIIAEIRGILEGLKLSQNLGITLIQVECDNLVAVQMINGDIPSPPVLASLISRIQHLLNQEWPCLLEHVYREANYAADFMADYSKQFPFGVHHVLQSPG
uniref:RNase H type-1 domain-containing protein n=1 Tax=Manihot esculenta TaxID=3983 RepID=A0A2C9U9I4_MANES